MLGPVPGARATDRSTEDTVLAALWLRGGGEETYTETVTDITSKLPLQSVLWKGSYPENPQCSSTSRRLRSEFLRVELGLGLEG